MIFAEKNRNYFSQTLPTTKKLIPMFLRQNHENLVTRKYPIIWYPTFVPNIKVLGAVVLEKSLTNFPMYYTGVREGKMEKDGKNKSQHLGFVP